MDGEATVGGAARCVRDVAIMVMVVVMASSSTCGRPSARTRAVRAGGPLCVRLCLCTRAARQQTARRQPRTVGCDGNPSPLPPGRHASTPPGRHAPTPPGCHASTPPGRHAPPLAGDRALYDAVSPPLDAMGKAKFFLGEEGAGANMKLVSGGGCTGCSLSITAGGWDRMGRGGGGGMGCAGGASG